MKDFKSFNINHTVFVKFTDLGFARLVECNEVYRGSFPGWEEKTIEHYKSKVNEDGYFPIALWSFMSKFGPITDMGSPKYYEMTVLFNIKDLS